jgi:hypothetical protein
MRQTHLGGDKLFVDYAGDTVPVIVDRLTGEVRQGKSLRRTMAPPYCQPDHAGHVTRPCQQLPRLTGRAQQAC